MMIIPQFLRFYQGYTGETVMREYAVRFFSLVNAMYRIQAEESLKLIESIATAINGGDDVIAGLRKQARGIHGIVQEVRTIKG
jgi:hypothetical protein